MPRFGFAEYIEAPTIWTGGEDSVFLAGGITNCPDWQKEARAHLEGSVTVLNPRRDDFPIDDPSAAPAQIEWEFNHLRRAKAILFWFTAGESVQPIVLYELGRHAALNRPIAVGVESGYSREQDVREQLALARPDVWVQHTLKNTCIIAEVLAKR